jgi:hypothetical protein
VLADAAVGAGSKDMGLRPLKKDPCGLQRKSCRKLDWKNGDGGG